MRKIGFDGRGVVAKVNVKKNDTVKSGQPLFTVEVRLASGESERAKAGAKRQGEQAAARGICSWCANPGELVHRRLTVDH